MSPRAVSLRAQLLTAFVVVVVGTTAGLTFDAYRTSIAGLEAKARQDAAVAAHSRAQAIDRMLANRQRRLEGVLAAAIELCAEPKPTGKYAWAPDCMGPIVNAVRTAERSTGILLRYDGRQVITSGSTLPTERPPYDKSARVQWEKGRQTYVMRAERDGLEMLVQYNNSEIASIFRDDASHLGERGESFLFDEDGAFLTAPKYPRGFRGTPPGAPDLEPVAACAVGGGDLLAPDYRGVMTIHAFQPVQTLDGACVDAHVNYDEVLKPAEQLRDRLLARGVIFIIAGALFSLFASHRIAAPVRRLARAARGLRTRLDEPIPVAGPLEVQALGLALREASTELAALVGREQTARREAQAANTAKDRFLAAVSHELRTPLTAILGWTRIIRGQKPVEHGFDRGLSAIERNAERQRQLIEDLLDVSRIVTGRLRIDRQTLELGEIVERALDAVRPQADEKNIDMQTLVNHAEALPVLGDRLRLEQVVSNLAANAVKFTPSGGSVLVTLKRVDGTAQLCVADDGEGIEETMLPHVFEWFWQGEAPPGDAPSGLGLGLGIVRQLVEIHGGSVRAESEGLGLGARFIVTLPLAAQSETPAPPPVDTLARSVATPRSSFNVH
jgi:signal transduction histidine kinase